MFQLLGVHCRPVHVSSTETQGPRARRFTLYIGGTLLGLAFWRALGFRGKTKKGTLCIPKFLLDLVKLLEAGGVASRLDLVRDVVCGSSDASPWVRPSARVGLV